MTEPMEAMRRCPVCDVETVPAHLGGLRLGVRKLGSRRATAAEPRVCPKCGRVEFFLVSTDKFREPNED